jgi:hypothetical protein
LGDGCGGNRGSLERKTHPTRRVGLGRCGV